MHLTYILKATLPLEYNTSYNTFYYFPCKSEKIKLLPSFNLFFKSHVDVKEFIFWALLHIPGL